MISTMAKRVVVVLALFLAVISIEAGSLARGGPSVSPTHLHFYFHDKVSKPSPSSVQVMNPVDPSSPSFFGGMRVMDNSLTEGSEPESRSVGQAQGMYMGSDQAKLGFFQAMNLVFTDGPYNGSVVAVLGRNSPLDDVREMPVIGGTGAFRFARGYAQARTHTLDVATGDAVVEYNIYIMH
ncbi:hypothetical protein ABZP36_000653 [Zizania latifolia]